MVCLRNEPLVRSLFSAAFGLSPAKRAARRTQFFILGVDGEREDVSQDVLRELLGQESACFLVCECTKHRRARAKSDLQAPWL